GRAARDRSDAGLSETTARFLSEEQGRVRRPGEVSRRHRQLAPAERPETRAPSAGHRSRKIRETSARQAAVATVSGQRPGQQRRRILEATAQTDLAGLSQEAVWTLGRGGER